MKYYYHTMNNINYQPIVADENPVNAYYIYEAAVRLRMSVKSVRRQIDRGHLRKCKVLGRVLIPRKDVDAFIEKFSVYSFAQ